MTPLLVATGGHIPCRDSLKLATDGFMGSCAQVTRSYGRGLEYVYKEDQAIKEDEEILAVIMSFMKIL